MQLVIGRVAGHRVFQQNGTSELTRKAAGKIGIRDRQLSRKWVDVAVQHGNGSGAKTGASVKLHKVEGDIDVCRGSRIADEIDRSLADIDVGKGAEMHRVTGVDALGDQAVIDGNGIGTLDVLETTVYQDEGTT